MTIWGMEVVVTDAVAPDELVLHGANSVRYTPDGGVEIMSQYQHELIAEAVRNAE